MLTLQGNSRTRPILFPISSRIESAARLLVVLVRMPFWNLVLNIQRIVRPLESKPKLKLRKLVDAAYSQNMVYYKSL